MGNCKSSAIKKDVSKKKCITLAILGLDNAGKTVTAKGLLGQPDEMVAPTIGFSNLSFQFRDYHITLYDLGGGKNIRDIWKNYLSDVYGLIYVIDSSDLVRLCETKIELFKLVNNDLMKGKPLLILANKQDVTGALDKSDLCNELNLELLVNELETPCKIENCSAQFKNGKSIDGSISHGFEWLVNAVNENWTELHERVNKDTKVKLAKEAQEKAEKMKRLRRNSKKNSSDDKYFDEKMDEKVPVKNPFKPIRKISFS